MKKEIWFDIDDVLVDTSAQIHKVLLDKTGQDIPVETWESHLFSKMYQLGESRVE